MTLAHPWNRTSENQATFSKTGMIREAKIATVAVFPFANFRSGIRSTSGNPYAHALVAFGGRAAHVGWFRLYRLYATKQGGYGASLELCLYFFRSNMILNPLTWRWLCLKRRRSDHFQCRFPLWNVSLHPLTAFSATSYCLYTRPIRYYQVISFLAWLASRQSVCWWRADFRLWLPCVYLLLHRRQR